MGAVRPPAGRSPAAPAPLPATVGTESPSADATAVTAAVLAVPFVLAGVGIGAAETAEHAAVAALAPDEVRGSAFGLLAAVQAFGNLIASGVAGLLWTIVSPTAAFVFAGTLMLVAVIALLAAGKNERVTAPA